MHAFIIHSEQTDAVVVESSPNQREIWASVSRGNRTSGRVHCTWAHGDWLARPEEADHGKNKIYQVPAGSSSSSHRAVCELRACICVPATATRHLKDTGQSGSSHSDVLLI